MKRAQFLSWVYCGSNHRVTIILHQRSSLLPPNMKRIKGIFSIFKFKKPIKVRESFDLQMLEKMSALVSSSLEKQVLITAAHPLLQVSAKAKEIAQLGHPQKVIVNSPVISFVFLSY